MVFSLIGVTGTAIQAPPDVILPIRKALRNYLQLRRVPTKRGSSLKTQAAAMNMVMLMQNGTMRRLK